VSDLAAIAQAPRLLRITTPLGPDALVLRRLSAREAIGELFKLQAEVLSREESLDSERLIGHPITCEVLREMHPPRYFHGIVRAITRIGPHGRGYTSYRLEAVPRLWHLGRTGDCRVFQELSVREIAETLLKEAQAGPARMGAMVPTAPIPYAVQFNETDLSFFSRLFEEAGCGYFFRHESNDHSLHLAGSNADFPLIPGEPQLVRTDLDLIGGLGRWQPRSILPVGSVRAADYDGLRPSTLLDAEAKTVVHATHAANMEIFRWPGGQAVRPDAEPARLMMEREEAASDVIEARGGDPSLFAGGRLRVRAGLDATASDTYLIVAIHHEAFDDTHLVEGGGADYSHGLQLIPASRPWRPASPHPRPAMTGLHCAVVTGPSGEEIHCDAYGRVKVRFLWDRLGASDDTSSCWLRVAQGFGGAWGGAWTLPRIGDEVLVGFLDGDPDRPVVLGSLYNAEQKPPFELPAQKTRSGLRTRSSKGGSAENFNMLMLDDQKGQEMFALQAEKDLELLVKNDRSVVIRGDHRESVGGHRRAEVEAGDDTLLVKQGNISTKASLGRIEMEAMQSITLKVGGSCLTIDPSGISLKGPMLKLEGNMMVSVKAPMVQADAAGMLTLKAGIVLIN
jgi:type VI secretion system secreted protein VgrG